MSALERVDAAITFLDRAVRFLQLLVVIVMVVMTSALAVWPGPMTKDGYSIHYDFMARAAMAFAAFVGCCVYRFVRKLDGWPRSRGNLPVTTPEAPTT